MKKLFALLCLLSLAVGCQSASKHLNVYSSKPESIQNVCLSEKNGIMAIPEPTDAIADDFKGTLDDKWQPPFNHSNVVTFKTGLVDGRQSMVWINEQPEDKEYDTETALASKPFAVADFYELDLAYAAKSTVGPVLRSSIIHYENYDFKICWYKAGETKPFKETFFNCETSPNEFVPNSHVFIVPDGAATATLHYGFGKPNFQKGQLFAITDFKLIGFGKKGRVSPNASFVTAPMILHGTSFDFNALQPQGTSLQFSFAYAPDDNGAPGVWSAWSAPVTAKGTLAPTPGAAWVKCKVELKSDGTAAASVKSITIGGRTMGNWTNIIAPEPPDAFLASPSPAKPTAPVKMKIAAKSDINWKTSEILLDGKDAKPLFSSSFLIEDGIISYTPQTPIADGVHEITLKLKTIDGGIIDKSCFFFVGPERTNSPQVTLRHDGMMLVDGKPFFQIGMYYLKPFDGNNNDLDTMFKDLRSRGFNIGREAGNFFESEPAIEFVKAAERNDFHVFMTAGFTQQGANTQDLRAIAEGVAKMRNFKSLLMWYIGDDTCTHNTPRGLTNKTDTVKAIDPGRITIQADVIGSTADSHYLPFVNCTDCFHIEIYPIHKGNKQRDHENCVYQTIADVDCAVNDVKKAATSPKNICSIIQYFASKADTPHGWDFPTATELRGMTYASIIRGVHGITWYNYAKAVKYYTAGSIPERWEELSSVASELNSLLDVLTAEAIPQPEPPVIVKGNAVDKSGRVPVYVLLKRSDKRTVLMTVNASIEDVTAKIALPGITSAKELFPEKDFALTAPGVLEIPFTRHQVRVFEVK